MFSFDATIVISNQIACLNSWGSRDALFSRITWIITWIKLDRDIICVIEKIACEEVVRVADIINKINL